MPVALPVHMWSTELKPCPSHSSLNALDSPTPAVEPKFDGIRREFEDLVRIPSVSAPGFDPEPVWRSAEATAAWLRSSGLDGVRLLEVDGANPAVFGAKQGPAGSPTLLLYAHHD